MLVYMPVESAWRCVVRLGYIRRSTSSSPVIKSNKHSKWNASVNIYIKRLSIWQQFDVGEKYFFRQV